MPFLTASLYLQTSQGICQRKKRMNERKNQGDKEQMNKRNNTAMFTTFVSKRL